MKYFLFFIIPFSCFASESPVVCVQEAECSPSFVSSFGLSCDQASQITEDSFSDDFDEEDFFSSLSNFVQTDYAFEYSEFSERMKIEDQRKQFIAELIEKEYLLFYNSLYNEEINTANTLKQASKDLRIVAFNAPRFSKQLPYISTLPEHLPDKTFITVLRHKVHLLSTLKQRESYEHNRIETVAKVLRTQRILNGISDHPGFSTIKEAPLIKERLLDKELKEVRCWLLEAHSPAYVRALRELSLFPVLLAKEVEKKELYQAMESDRRTGCSMNICEKLLTIKLRTKIQAYVATKKE
jgi:hypothetical protein